MPQNSQQEPSDLHLSASKSNALESTRQLQFGWGSQTHPTNEPRRAEAEVEEPERWDGMS